MHISASKADRKLSCQTDAICTKRDDRRSRYGLGQESWRCEAERTDGWCGVRGRDEEAAHCTEEVRSGANLGKREEVRLDEIRLG